MHTPRRRLAILLVPFAIASFSVVSACSGAQEYVDHGFEFDAPTDSPGIQILDFKYGDGIAHGTANPDYILKQGRSLQRIAVYGHIPRPDSLYVRWRVIANGGTYEDTVDLRKRLPRDFTGSKLYFVVDGSRLEVYLISMEPRQPNFPKVGPRKFHHLRVTKLYPD